MTSTLNSASTVRMLHRFAARRPEWFAVLVFLAYILPPIVLGLLVQQGRSDPANPVQLAGIAWSALVPAVLLTALGWWGTAGFTRRSTWRSLIPFLPLVLLFAVPPVPLVFGPRVASHTPGYLTLVAVSALAAGFGTEATLRGLVLQTLPPAGACVPCFSHRSCSARYLSPLLPQARTRSSSAQALATMGIGVAFAAVVVVTARSGHWWSSAPRCPSHWESRMTTRQHWTPAFWSAA